MTLEALALAAALCGAGETVLLEFTAQWCGPCRAMAPTIERMAADGYPIRQVDVDRDRALAARFGVRAVPCFVMIADGREVERVEGASSYARLARMFETARFAPSPGGGPGLVRGQSPESAPGRGPTALQGEAAESPQGPAAAAEPPPPAQRELTPAERARKATVRLRIEDPQGHSYGTGTIIDAHGAEALVLTCGHIFRDSQGQGGVAVDLFQAGSPQSVPGRLIHYDLQRDVGFVSFRAPAPVAPVRVAPSGYRIRQGDEVFSVGCDQGGQPTVRRSRISAIDKYLGSPNVEVAGQPVDGRSGGGLFSSEARLIGVCNAADPADDEGIYAALATIHRQLDLIGQQRVYEPDHAALAESAAAGAGGPAESGRDPAASQPQPPASLLQAVATGQQAPGAAGEAHHGGPPGEASGQASDTEVICIIRSRSNPHQQSRIVVLDQPSTALLERLERESHAADSGPASASGVRAAEPSRPPYRPGVSPAVFRGQSAES